MLDYNLGQGTLPAVSHANVRGSHLPVLLVQRVYLLPFPTGVPRELIVPPFPANSSDPVALLLAARVVRSKAQASKGYGFVKFQHVQQAVEAIRTFNGFILNNHPLEVKFADQDAGPPLSGILSCAQVCSHQHHQSTQTLCQ